MYESKKKCFLAGVYFPNIKLDLVTSSYDFAKYIHTIFTKVNESKERENNCLSGSITTF